MNLKQMDLQNIKSRMIGNIIISSLIEKTPAYLYNFVKRNIAKIENKEYYAKLVFQEFADVSKIKNNFREIIAVIKNVKNFQLLLHYNYKYLNGIFLFNNRHITPELIKNILDKEFNLILYKLRRINYLNNIVFTILCSLLNLQKEYFLTGNELKLKPILLNEIEDYIKNYYKIDIDKSLISRFIKNKTLIDLRGEEIPLTHLCCNKRFVYMKYLDYYFKKEGEKLLIKQITRPLSDLEISKYLLSRYGIKISRRQITKYRNILGIDNSFKRVIIHNYVPEHFSFSPFYSLTKRNVRKYTLNFPGLYEIHLVDEVVNYNNKYNSVIYIGSTKNIRKRLSEHLYSKNKLLKSIILNKKCKFRFILDFKNYRLKERILLMRFYKKYKTIPVCNKLIYQKWKHN